MDNLQPPQNLEPSPKKSNKAVKFVIVGVIASFILVAGAITGVIQFSIATIRCGQLPVAATNFAAAYTFELPGEKGYGPSIFNQYFCTRKEAEHAGFRHSTLTDLGEKEQDEEYRKFEEERSFNPSKVPFVAYTPTYIPLGFEKESKLSVQKYPQGMQVFQEIIRKSDTYAMGTLRQGLLGDSYEVCIDTRACKVIGTTQSGQPIYKDVNKWYSVKFEKSFMNLEPQERFGLTDAEAVKILSTLVPAQ